MIKRPHCRNYRIYFNQILHSDRDNPSTLRGLFQYAYNQLNMADGRHLEKSKNGYISATVWPIGTKFGTMTHVGIVGPLNREGSYNFKLLGLLFEPILPYKTWFCYVYIYRNYMKHHLLIKSIKCIQSSFIDFNMKFVLQISISGTMCNFIYTVLLWSQIRWRWIFIGP